MIKEIAYIIIEYTPFRFYTVNLFGKYTK